MEQFTIPGAGGIIVKNEGEENLVLLQERVKSHAPPYENGLLEIPAGKIRAYENIFDTLKREVKEETGLNVIRIIGENNASICTQNNYKVINFMPYSCSQNINGNYPIMVLVFICQVTGKLLKSSNESRNYKWVSIKELKELVFNYPDKLFPMHVDTLKKFVVEYS